MRSTSCWFTESCNSQYLSHFAGAFIVVRAKTKNDNENDTLIKDGSAVMWCSRCCVVVLCVDGVVVCVWCCCFECFRLCECLVCGVWCRVYRQHVHMSQSMWMCCRYTRRRFESTEACREPHTSFSTLCSVPQHIHIPHTKHTQQHHTPLYLMKLSVSKYPEGNSGGNQL